MGQQGFMRWVWLLQGSAQMGAGGALASAPRHAPTSRKNWMVSLSASTNASTSARVLYM